MRLLVDTNIILEVILEQPKASEARALLAKSDEHEFFLTDFSLHSIGLLLFRRKEHDVFRRFMEDMVFHAGTTVACLPAEAMESVTERAQTFNLDFDDAYQYVAAEKYRLTLVSFDTDFDRTARGRKTPAELLS